MGAAQSLDELMDVAVEAVPHEFRKCAPVAVKATAGLRLLGVEEAAAILAAVQKRLETKYPFPLAKEDPVVIMDGKEEGVYAWITANYLLDTIRATTAAGTSTYAVLDLGGGSTQIVFEPTFTSDDTTLLDGEHKYELQFGGHTHVLYQHSYLGYGLMSARRSIHRLVEFMWTISHATEHGDSSHAVIGNPCLAKGTERVVEIEVGRNGELRNVNMDGADIGGFEACKRVVELVMAKDAVCQVKPCSFNGVYQPSLLDTFPQGKVLLLSYFYDRLFPLLSPGSSITVKTVADLAHRVCQGKLEWMANWGHEPSVMLELEERPEYCLDLTFQHALLRLGYEFEDHREIRIEKQLSGTELGWCLGASIAMLHGHLECKA